MRRLGDGEEWEGFGSFEVDDGVVFEIGDADSTATEDGEEGAAFER